MDNLESQLKIKTLVESGEISIIPIGFRCFTAKLIKEKLGVFQTSLPFNTGFFPPDAVASILDRPRIAMSFDDDGETHSVCIKHESNSDPNHGRGIRFETSSYDEINLAASDKNNTDIGKYLDSTFGYYTLDKSHQFILAHYNWHRFADDKKSNGITDPRKNIEALNIKLNRRIDRMLSMCEKSRKIVFIFSETQKYKYMQIDTKFFDLSDFSNLSNICDNRYKGKCSIANIVDIEGATDFLKQYT